MHIGFHKRAPLYGREFFLLTNSFNIFFTLNIFKLQTQFSIFIFDYNMIL